MIRILERLYFSAGMYGWRYCFVWATHYFLASLICLHACDCRCFGCCLNYATLWLHLLSYSHSCSSSWQHKIEKAYVQLIWNIVSIYLLPIYFWDDSFVECMFNVLLNMDTQLKCIEALTLTNSYFEVK